MAAPPSAAHCFPGQRVAIPFIVGKVQRLYCGSLDDHVRDDAKRLKRDDVQWTKPLSGSDEIWQVTYDEKDEDGSSEQLHLRTALRGARAYDKQEIDFKGVFIIPNAGKWNAQFTHKGITLRLGKYDSAKAAAQAWCVKNQTLI